MSAVPTGVHLGPRRLKMRAVTTWWLPAPKAEWISLMIFQAISAMFWRWWMHQGSNLGPA